MNKITPDQIASLVSLRQDLIDKVANQEDVSALSTIAEVFAILHLDPEARILTPAEAKRERRSARRQARKAAKAAALTPQPATDDQAEPSVPDQLDASHWSSRLFPKGTIALLSRAMTPSVFPFTRLSTDKLLSTNSYKRAPSTKVFNFLIHNNELDLLLDILNDINSQVEV